MIKWVEYRLNEERLRELKLFSLENRRVQGDLMAAFQYVKGVYRKDGSRLFNRASCDMMRDNGFKLEKSIFRLYIRNIFFTIRMVRHWNRLHREVIDAPPLETFKT